MILSILGGVLVAAGGLIFGFGTIGIIKSDSWKKRWLFFVIMLLGVRGVELGIAVIK